MKRLVVCIVLALLVSTSPTREATGNHRELQDSENKKPKQEKDSPDEAVLLGRVLAQMEETYQGLQSYRAEFDQESETRSFQRKKQSSGRVYFQKPGRMRWSYLHPEKREVYVIQEQIHIFLPNRNQVIRQTLSDALPGMAPARLFMGIDELLGSFAVSLTDADQEDEKAYCLRLIPRKKGTLSVEEILLWVGKKDFLPLRTESRDVLGNRTTVVFRNGEGNVQVEEELFLFQIPPEAEVLDNLF